MDPSSFKTRLNQLSREEKISQLNRAHSWHLDPDPHFECGSRFKSSLNEKPYISGFRTASQPNPGIEIEEANKLASAFKHPSSRQITNQKMPDCVAFTGIVIVSLYIPV